MAGPGGAGDGGGDGTRRPGPIPLPDPPLVDRGAGIVLRPWTSTPTDVAALVAAWRDPAVAAGARVPGDPSPEVAARWIAGADARRARGLALDLVVAPLAGGPAVLGEVGLRNVDRARRRAEVGWWVGAPHRGRGLATAAVRLLVGWALSDAAGLVQVWARTDPANDASARVAARAGFRRLGEAGGAVVWSRERVGMPGDRQGRC
ncbi:MAG TPA: GNAT family N-acetyltransferase [Acidimicrobiales bacterium]|jgi:RimJ/RimL family protein N-acetyltransferase|nr:GNAT family N-acetyltransferase [Acidimicrobiales bacterium]